MSDNLLDRGQLSLERQELLELLLKEMEEDTSQLSIPRRKRDTRHFPLSFAQQRLWFLDRLEPGNTAYIAPMALRIEGELAVTVLESSLHELVQRHESLRTRFEMQADQPVQVIETGETFGVSFVDLRLLEPEQRELEVRQLVQQETQHPFDLRKGGLLRATLVLLGERSFVLMLTMHHIISDGWSTGVLLREVSALYRAFSQGDPSPLPPLPIQYADYALWQREQLREEALNKQLTYWQGQLADVAPLELPTDYQRPGVQSFRGARVPVFVPEPLCRQLQQLSRREGVTLFMTLLTAFQVLLMRYSGQEDIAVGTPIANRMRPELEGLIGFFVNTLVMRTDLSSRPSFREALQKVREVCLDAYAHQDVPFEQIVEVLHPERDLSRSPLFQVMFVLQNTAIDSENLAQVELRPLSAESQVAKFDLMLELRESAGGLRGLLEYSTDLFEAETIQRLVGHWQRLLESVVANPDQAVTDLELLSKEERRQLLVEWNATTVEDGSEGLFQQIFEEQVRQTPDAIAGIDGDQYISYEELNRRANALAHYLQRQGVRQEMCVGVCMERSLAMLIGLLGILKAGGVYVPLDPAYPAERLTSMLVDSQVALVLTLHDWPLATTPEQVQVVSLAEDWPAIAQANPFDAQNSTVSQSLAYIIYTSGSTGRPKGAMVAQQGMLNHLWCKVRALQLTARDSVAQTASANFDISVWQLLSALLVGGCVQIVADDIAHDPLQLLEYVEQRQITILEVVPSLLRAMLNEVEGDIQSPALPLRWLLVTGEAFPAELGVRWLARYPSVPLLNAYGPTECSDDVTHEALRDGAMLKTWSVPIGKALANTQLYVLDAHLMPVPPGVPGELYVGGKGVGRGYMRNARQTAQSFIPDPFSGKAGARLYRTGDRVRYLKDGSLEYLGRLDEQIKLRGYRIELGEIEAVLARQPGVQTCAVVLRTQEATGPHLVAYVVPTPGADLEEEQVRAGLRTKLPEYMLPAAVVVLERLPLTPNGKLDRRALPAPAIRPLTQEPQDAPRTPVQELLAGIWQEVLGIARVGLHDNFFALGGHSLLATQLQSRIRRVFASELPLRTVFEAPTIALLAERIAQDQRSGLREQPIPALLPRDAATLSPLPLSFAQQRLWFLDQLEPGSATYNMTQGLWLEGDLDIAALEDSLHTMVQRHESLRTHFGEQEGQPVQVIEPVPASSGLRLVDLRGLEPTEREQVLRSLASQEGAHPFDLQQGPLLRATLVLLEARAAGLLLSLHHIISDGWSVQVLVRELSALYQALTRAETAPLPPLPIQYADYALWQRQWLQGCVLEEQLGYWRQQLAGVAPLELPTDHARPAIQRYRGARQRVRLSAEVSQGLRQMSQREGVTLFMALLAAFQVLLMRYSGQQDIAVGTPIANRTRPEVEGLIGFFVNTLVMRTDLSGRPSFREVLRRVREVCLGAYAHQDVPFEQVVEALQPERDLSRSPLFQVMLTLQQRSGEERGVEQLEASSFGVESSTAKFDLSLDLSESGSGMLGQIEYSTDLFEAETIQRLAGHWQRLLEVVVANPEQVVTEIDLLSEEERRQLLVEWNAGQQSIPDKSSLQALFEEQVERTPDAVAVVYGDERLSYGALDQMANRVASYLRQNGVVLETPVGICLERSVTLLVCLLGVLKAGGTYVPLDPALPPERLRFMLDDARLSLLLTHSSIQERLAGFQAAPVYLDQCWTAIQDQSGENTRPPSSPAAAAYIIYTSGSTGNPKGVVVTHGSLVNAYFAWKEAYQLQEGMVHLQMASFSFDVFSGDVVRALCSGGRLVICPQEDRLESQRLHELMQREYIQCVEFVPALLRSLAEHVLVVGQRLDWLKLLIVGSDGWTREDYLHFQALCGTHTRLLNSYGITETTIDSTYFADEAAQLTPEQTIPIGRPFAGTRIYVLDYALQPVPVGVPGELYIGGAGVSRGYLNRFDLTAERFLPDPWGQEPGARMYRTGDLARFLPNGNLVYLGRKDGQIKLRGYRIELGEIEAVLARQPGVQTCAVVLRTLEAIGPHLVAYVAPTPGAELEEEQVRAGLRTRLPEYMLPAAVVVLERLPLTPNGKLDRRALPAPAIRPLTQEPQDAPRTPVQELLAGIWQEVLGIARVGLHDNFFALGGHSLLATQLQSRIRRVFASELPLRTVFEAPTIALLAERIAQGQHEGATARPLPPLLPRAPFLQHVPLSFAQQRLWFLNQLEPGSAAYNLPLALRLEGELDSAALEDSLRALVQRHESLRTHFGEQEDQPVQVIESVPASSGLRLVDLRGLEPTEREQVLRSLASQEGARPFDLQQGPLLRATLVLLEERAAGLLLSLHHIISDGWSVQVLVRELSALYQALTRAETAPLPPLPIQYADYALWQRQWLQGRVLEEQLGYWRQQLAGVAPLELPTDHARPAVQRYRGARQRVWLSAEVSQGLRQVSQREGVTLFMALLAAFQVLLMRYSGQQDIAVGTPIANRSRPEVEGLIGFFVNTLVMRTDLSGRPSFREVLQRVREVCLGAYAHQDVPFEQVVEALQPERDLSRSPLFQVMLTMQNVAVADADVEELGLRPVGMENTTAQFDLTLELLEYGGEIGGQIEYSTDLFEAETIQRLVGHWQRLLASVVANPEQPVTDLELLSKEERRQLLVEWNASEQSPVDKPCLHVLFEEQVERTPDAVAILFAEQQISYKALNQRANGLAYHLRELGVGPEICVGLCVERSLEMVIGLLGILKAGGVYVPLDPGYPIERLNYILRDARVPVLVTQQPLLSKLPTQGIEVVCLDEDQAFAPGQSDINPVTRILPANLAYIIYTSGSTGQPKGVQISQEALVNFLYSMRTQPGLCSSDILLAVTTLSFDIAGLELYLPLITGARLVIADREIAVDGSSLIEALERHGITIMQATPSTWRLLLAAGWQGNAHLKSLCGGEGLPFELSQQLLPKVGALWNMYGPTETTIWSTLSKIEPEDRLITVGRPIANTSAFILDQYLQPVPPGVPGTLYIGGDGLARGYLHRPELTAERFIADALSGNENARLYNTGDHARYRSDGSIEILGRADQQIKLRGYRIELGEIEAVLARQPGVQTCAVVLRTLEAIGPHLVAYVAPTPGAELEEEQVRAGLRTRLPEYMLPAAVVVLERLPLTPNGKLDRRALPAPAIRPLTQKQQDAPRTPVQELLAGIWQEVLGIARVGLHDNFFALGGHSLLATQLQSRIRRVFAQELPLRTVFEAPTIAVLAERIAQGQHEGATARPLPPLLPRAPFLQHVPLSFAQQRLWFLDQLEPGSTAYNLPLALRLEGELDSAALEDSLHALVQRHESLRTHFGEQEGQPVQVIETVPASSGLRLVDLRGLEAVEREQVLRSLASQEEAHPFDLQQGPLLRATLVLLEARVAGLLLNLHHIISDGWSMQVLVRELSALYQALTRAEPSPLPPLPIQYADYALWQRQWLQGRVLEEQLGYWRQQLAGVAPLELPTDHARPAVQRYRGARQRVWLSAEVSQGLRQMSQREGVTLFMALLAAFQVLLMRYSGQQDIAVGTPIANRSRPEVEGLIGFFVNTLVMRTDLSGRPSFREVLRRVREVCLGAYAHQDVPFEQVVEALQPERDLSRSPLFQVMLTLQQRSGEERNVEQLEASAFGVESRTAKFDLSLDLSESESGIRGQIEYSTDLFEVETIQRLVGHWQRVVEQVVANPEQVVTEIDLLSEEERRQLLGEWNAGAPISPREDGLHTLFEAQARRTPDAVALIFEDTHLSYGELNRRANQVAHYLQAIGVGPEVRVGLCVERSPVMVIGMLAILKAGGAYVPLDPAYPRERLDFIAQDACLKLVLTQRELLEQRLFEVEQILCLDTPDLYAQESAENPVLELRNEQLAYVIYTSGSTGRPKGVGICHKNTVVFLHWARQEFSDAELAGVLFGTSVCFDLSIFEVFAPLSWGGRMILVASVLNLPHLAARQYVTLLNTVPSAATALLASGDLPPSLLTINLAGEALSRDLIQALYRQTNVLRVCNLYGPTEDTTYSTWATMEPAEQGAVTIGRPLVNTRAYIVDAQMQPVPVGVAGELYLGGDGQARGYLNRPALTAERFVPDPFSGEPGKRLYRTGDRARYLEDGRIEYLGRVDGQVKLRGYRIELGEIEAVLARQPGVQAAVVALREEARGQQLVAYVVARPGVKLAVEQVRAGLRATLPAYMLPSAVVELEALPLTPNGKLDRRALPAPAGGQVVVQEQEEPRTPTQQLLAGLWQQVLGIEQVGIHDNFFTLGGHSMLTVQLMTLIQQTFAKKLSLTTLFQNATIAEQAELLQQPQELASSSSSLVRLRSYGSQQPLFLVHPKGGYLFSYSDLVRCLDIDRPIYGLQAKGVDSEDEELHTSIEAMAAYYIGVIQRVQPAGPYHLCGYSMGGLIAFEMAQQLQEQGQKVDFLALLDCATENEDIEDVNNPDERVFLVNEFSRYFPLTLDDLEGLNPDEQALFIMRRAQQAEMLSPLTDPGLERVRRYIAIARAHVRACVNYKPGVYQGRITYFKSSADVREDAPDPTMDWSAHATEGVELFIVPGAHLTMVRPPHVFALSRDLQASLNRI